MGRAFVTCALGLACVLAALPVRAETPPVLLFSFGSAGTAPGQFEEASGLAIGPDGTVFVADYQLGRVSEFTGAGVFVGAFSSPGGAGGWWDVAIGPTGTRYVSDGGTIHVYDAANTFIRDLSASPWVLSYLFYDRQQPLLHAATLRWAVTLDTMGTAPTAWPFMSTNPSALIRYDQGSDGLLYFPDYVADRIRVYTPGGALVRSWGTSGTGPGQLSRPRLVALDAQDNVYVADDSNVIEKYTSTGAYLWSTAPVYPDDIEIDGAGRIYVAQGHQVSVFGDAATPTLRRSWGALKQRYAR